MTETDTIESINQHFKLQDEAMDLHAKKFLDRLIGIYNLDGGKGMFNEIATFTGHNFMIKY